MLAHSFLLITLLFLDTCKLSGQLDHHIKHRPTLGLNPASLAKRSASDPRRNDFQYNKLTNEEVANILRNNDFLVKNFSDTPPLAIMGDMAFYAETLLPLEMGLSSERITNIQNARLWIDSGGRQQVWYYYDTHTRADRDIFEKAVQTWAAATCIQFHRLPPGDCHADRGHGAICVGDFGGCFSHVGNSYDETGHRSQKMSVKPRGCETAAAAHEFGHALGLHHQQARPDVDQYLFVNVHLMDIQLQDPIAADVKSKWLQASRCDKAQMLDLPIPYDYMSLMQYGPTDFAEGDARLVYAAKDVRHQYMLGYHREAGMLDTHYDRLVVNTAYKCVDMWKKRCQDNGHAPPKCQHNGYVTERCTCACPPGYTGHDCGSADGSIYPIQDRAKTMVHVTEEQVLDLGEQGMHLENNGYAMPTFVFLQFITVVVDAGHKRARATIEVDQPFYLVARTLRDSRVQGFFLQNMALADCEKGLKFFWGDAATNQMRTECLSSMVTNEPSHQRRRLRGRTRHLGISATSSIGRVFTSEALSMQVLQMSLDVRFSANPRSQLRYFATRAEDPGPLASPVRHKKGSNVRTALIVVSVLVVLVVILAVCAGIAWKMGTLDSCLNR